ncbi:MAG: hypothetical protein ACYC26_08575 [Phycisphaerales bacterium]
MKGQTMRRMFTTALGGMMMLAATTAVRADTIVTTVIDDFTSDTLNANWVQSVVYPDIYSTPATMHVFNTTTATDQLTILRPDYFRPQMEALLRSDASLGVGQTLLTDLTVPATVSDSHGLMIATATGVTGYITGVNTGHHAPDTLFIGWFPGNRTVRTQYYDHASTLTQILTAALPIGVVPTEFFMERTAANVYEAGYVLSNNPGVRVVLSTTTITGVGNLNPGAAIGYRGDIRFDGASASFDNLRLEIPEPATMGLLALGGLLMLPRRR